MRELEFLSEDYLRARFHRRIGFLRSWLLLALGLAMVLWSLQMGTWVRDARADLLALRSAKSAVEPDVAKVQMLRGEAQGYNRRFDLVQALRPRITAAEVLAVLTDVLPDSVVVDEVSLVAREGVGRCGATLRLSGIGPKETVVIARLLGALESAPQFERAVLVDSKPYGRDGADCRAFIVEADVVPVTPAKEP